MGLADDVRNELKKVTEHKAFYAAAGAGDLAREVLRALPDRLARLQDKADPTALSGLAFEYVTLAAARAVQAYDELADRGMVVINRMDPQQASAQLEQAARSTGQLTARTADAARKAAHTAVRAAGQVAAGAATQAGQVAAEAATQASQAAAQAATQTAVQASEVMGRASQAAGGASAAAASSAGNASSSAGKASDSPRKASDSASKTSDSPRKTSDSARKTSDSASKTSHPHKKHRA